MLVFLFFFLSINEIETFSEQLRNVVVEKHLYLANMFVIKLFNDTCIFGECLTFVASFFYMNYFSYFSRTLVKLKIPLMLLISFESRMECIKVDLY